MKILVIGGAGYIGSHVVKELMKGGNEIVVFDNLSSGLRQNLFPKNKFIYGNILIPSDLEKAFAEKFDACIHLAAFKAAGESMIAPEKYSVNNITGTINILNAAVAHDCKRFVFSSTAAVYGEPQYLPIDESHPKKPENFYGYTKLAIEELLAWYEKLRGIRFAALRYFNAAGYDVTGELFGLEQNPANLIPVIMEAAIGIRKRVKIFGNDYDTRDGTCIRDYVHVDDLARAHAKALDYISKNSESLLLNLGSEKGTSVLEIVESSRRITGKAIPSDFAPRRAGDPATLFASAQFAAQKLGWKAEHSDIDTIIESTWRAYEKYTKLHQA